MGISKWRAKRMNFVVEKLHRGESNPHIITDYGSHGNNGPLIRLPRGFVVAMFKDAREENIDSYDAIDRLYDNYP